MKEKFLFVFFFIQSSAVFCQTITFTDSTRGLYIRSDSVMIGFDKLWGGAVREVIYKNGNLINNHDGGRLSGISLYDGADFYNGQNNYSDWGWNPTPSDKYSNTNAPITYSFQNDTLYIESRNVQWNPDGKGGGAGQPVPGDFLVESWVSFLPNNPNCISIVYKVTHDGQDFHAALQQEFPYVYINPPYNRFVTYRGYKPWTNDTMSVLNPPVYTHASIAATEYWGAFVNSADEGITLYTPQEYPEYSYVSLPAPGPGDSSYYMDPFSYLSLNEGWSIKTQIYLYIGNYLNARNTIYNLHNTRVYPDILSPTGNIDAPTNNSIVSGTINVQGWVADDRKVQKIEVLVDGILNGIATYGSIVRNDVASAGYYGFANSPDFGFSYALNTTLLPDGIHIIQVQAFDSTGNANFIKPTPNYININVQNINSSPCNYSINTTKQLFAISGGNDSLKITTNGSCSWAVMLDTTFVKMLDSINGIGSYTIKYSVKPNPTSYTRQCIINAGGLTDTIIQEGIAVDTSTGINKQQIIENPISLFPNPNNGIFTICFKNVSNKSQIEIYNVLGEKVYQAKLNVNTTQISVGIREAGIYLYRVLTKEGNLISSGKFVIE